MRIRNAANGLVRLLATGAVALGTSGEAKGEGILDIRNFVGSNSAKFTAVHYDSSFGAVDGKDSFDVFHINPPSGNPSISSDIVTHNLKEDYRSNPSSTPFNVKLLFNGTISTPTANHLEFAMPYGAGWEFEHKDNIVFQSPSGDAYDVRAIIDGIIGGDLNPSAGRFNLLDVDAGSYTTGTPYADCGIFFPLSGDSDLDGFVGFTDLNTVLSHYDDAGHWSKGDFNSDNMVDFTDLNTVLSNYNNGAGPDDKAYELLESYGINIPEPGTLSLLGVAGAGLGAYSLARRRKEPR